MIETSRPYPGRASNRDGGGDTPDFIATVCQCIRCLTAVYGDLLRLACDLPAFTDGVAGRCEWMVLYNRKGEGGGPHFFITPLSVP